MSYEPMPDTPQPLSTSGSSPLLVDVLFYLGAFLVLLTVPSVIAPTFIANSDQADLVLVLGIVTGSMGLLSVGLWAAILYRHPEWPWPLPLGGNAGMTRREHAFLLAWIGCVGAAGFGALAALIATQGLSTLHDAVFLIGALIVIAIIGAPAWFISRRMRRRTQGAR